MHLTLYLIRERRIWNTEQVLSEEEYRKAEEDFGGKFRVGMGAEAIKELLQAVDLDKEAETLTEELQTCNRTEACTYH